MDDLFYEAKEVVDDLNAIILHQNEENIEQVEWISFFVLEYSYNISQILFMDCLIWSSHEDEREILDEENDIREPLKNFVVRESEKILEFIKKVEFPKLSF